MHEENTKPPSIFISHTSSDKPFVRDLSAKLALFGVKAWVDEFEIHLGDSLLKKIAEGLGASDYVAAVLSPRSVESEWVVRELEVAINEEIEGRTVRVLPLLIESCAIPTFLKGKLYADFRGSFSTGLLSILKRFYADGSFSGTTVESIESWLRTHSVAIKPKEDFEEFVLQLEAKSRMEAFYDALLDEYVSGGPKAVASHLRHIVPPNAPNSGVILRLAARWENAPTCKYCERAIVDLKEDEEPIASGQWDASIAHVALALLYNVSKDGSSDVCWACE